MIWHLWLVWSSYINRIFITTRRLYFFKTHCSILTMKFFKNLRRNHDPPNHNESSGNEEVSDKEISFENEENIVEEPKIIEEEDATDATKSLLAAVSESESTRRRTSFEEFVDERLLVSTDALGNKQMKIKVLEVSDEHPPVQWRFGDRVKITKILVTIKHLATQNVEEAEFDIESIERELAEKRHYTSTNRWVPTTDIKNGYVTGTRHTSLVSDAVALDYIIF